MIWCTCKLISPSWRRLTYMYIDIASHLCSSVLYYCTAYVTSYHTACSILLKTSRPGFHNWLYMTFCWVSLLGSEYAWSDLNFILEVLCCKDITCTCVLNKWRHWLHSLEGLHRTLLVGGIGVGAYSERCEQFHDKYWRKNVGLCGDYNYYWTSVSWSLF